VVVIDRAGVVRFIRAGGERDEIEKALDAVLAEQAKPAKR
jgi:hypothetical protein